MSEWKEWNGSDEQIAEIKANIHGYLVRDALGRLSNRVRVAFDLDGVEIPTFEYLICNPHPLADMICQQAKTGQPVWIKCKESYHIHRTPYDEVHWTGLNNIYKTVTPDWNIPNAEYSFTEFKEEV